MHGVVYVQTYTRWLSLSRLIYLLTYLLTPRCRVLLEKLAGLQLVKKFPAFHGTRRFITALTSVRHLSLSWASPIQSIYPHPTSWRSILILSTHLRLGLPSGPQNITGMIHLRTYLFVLLMSLFSPVANLGYVVFQSSEVQVAKWLLIKRLKSYE